MKPIIIIVALALGVTVSSCGSGNRDNQMEDTTSIDTSMMDTSMNNLDTTGVADTAGVDTMYRNSPARSDTKSGNSKQ